RCASRSMGASKSGARNPGPAPRGALGGGGGGDEGWGEGSGGGAGTGVGRPVALAAARFCWTCESGGEGERDGGRAAKGASAAATSDMDRNLSPGALASARITAAATSGGTSAASAKGSGFSVSTDMIRRYGAVRAFRQGRRPVRSS